MNPTNHHCRKNRRPKSRLERLCLRQRTGARQVGRLGQLGDVHRDHLQRGMQPGAPFLGALGERLLLDSCGAPAAELAGRLLRRDHLRPSATQCMGARRRRRMQGARAHEEPPSEHLRPRAGGAVVAHLRGGDDTRVLVSNALMARCGNTQGYRQV